MSPEKDEMTGALIEIDPRFLKEVEKLAGTPVSACFHCMKCTNGCPVTYAMDYPPNKIMHMIQLGMRNKVLRTRTIWICASCETCTTRCPNDIDVAGVMDALRQLSMQAKIVAEPQVANFHRAFIEAIKSSGRVSELEMMGRYKLKTHDLFSDVRLGWELFKRGRLKLLPNECASKYEVRKLIEVAFERRHHL